MQLTRGRRLPMASPGSDAAGRGAPAPGAVGIPATSVSHCTWAVITEGKSRRNKPSSAKQNGRTNQTVQQFSRNWIKLNALCHI